MKQISLEQQLYLNPVARNIRIVAYTPHPARRWYCQRNLALNAPLALATYMNFCFYHSVQNIIRLLKNDIVLRISLCNKTAQCCITCMINYKYEPIHSTSEFKVKGISGCRLNNFDI